MDLFLDDIVMTWGQFFMISHRVEYEHFGARMSAKNTVFMSEIFLSVVYTTVILQLQWWPHQKFPWKLTFWSKFPDYRHFERVQVDCNPSELFRLWYNVYRTRVLHHCVVLQRCRWRILRNIWLWFLSNYDKYTW